MLLNWRCGYGTFRNFIVSLNLMEKIMNKLLVNTLVCFLSLFCAQKVCRATTNSALYAGLGLGISSIGDVEDATVKNGSGFAGRVFAGYNFNEYFGVEGAFAKLHTQNYVLNDYSWLSFNYQLSALSLVGKLYLPLNDRFSLNVSLGGAQMYTDFDATTVFDATTHYQDSSNTLTGVAGLGAGFDINDNLKTTLDFMVYGQKDGDESHFGVPETTLFTVGLAYKFN